VQEFNVMST